jgi:hypothetical protein
VIHVIVIVLCAGAFCRTVEVPVETCPPSLGPEAQAYIAQHHEGWRVERITCARGMGA